MPKEGAIPFTQYHVVKLDYAGKHTFTMVISLSFATSWLRVCCTGQCRPNFPVVASSDIGNILETSWAPIKLH